MGNANLLNELYLPLSYVELLDFAEIAHLMVDILKEFIEVRLRNFCWNCHIGSQSSRVCQQQD